MRNFARDERGVSAVEFAMLLPVLLFVLLGSVTVFDLFRTQQAAEKGTFTVGDMLSRQTSISENQLRDMLTFINKTVDYEGQARLRVSSVSNNGGKLVLDWTKSVGNENVALGDIPYGVVPAMASGDSVILTEAMVPHRAFVAGFGVDQITYQNRSVHRPRFVGKIAYQ